jgi:hypothetical protein
MYDFETVDVINIENEKRTTHPHVELPIHDQSAPAGAFSSSSRAKSDQQRISAVGGEEEGERGSLFGGGSKKQHIDWIDMKVDGLSEPPLAMASRQVAPDITKTNHVSDGGSSPETPKAKKLRKGLRHRHSKHYKS